MAADVVVDVVVDGANVVGSRPDGWWRDRPGAARRLHTALVTAMLPGRVVVVLEGAARRGVPRGDDGQVTTVHAPASGDDTVVDETQRLVSAGSARVLVVTADRALADRVTACGAEVRGPSWLLGRLAAD